MEEAWNNVKIDLITLIEMIPVLVEKNGDYRYFGTEPDSTPYTICRTRIGGRDCWIVSDSGEDSIAWVMECAKTTEGYMDDLLWFFEDNFGIENDGEIWVSNELHHD